MQQVTNSTQIKKFLGTVHIPMAASEVARNLGVDKQRVGIAMMEMHRAGELVRTHNGLYHVPGAAILVAREKPTVVPRTSEKTQRFPLVDNKDLKLRVLVKLEGICADDIAAVLKSISADIKRLDRYARGGR